MDAVAEVLFGKTRRAVLGLLYEQPGQGLYLREIAKLTGISTGALQHELMQLVRADLVVRTKDGNRVSYRANTLHPVFEDLRGLVTKTCGVAAQLAEALNPHAESIAFAAVYGSLAKGTNHARSDVDLLIVGSLSLAEAVDAVADVESYIGREISVRLYSPAEYRKRLDSGDRFLQGVITGGMIPVLGAPPDDA